MNAEIAILPGYVPLVASLKCQAERLLWNEAQLENPMPERDLLYKMIRRSISVNRTLKYRVTVRLMTPNYSFSSFDRQMCIKLRFCISLLLPRLSDTGSSRPYSVPLYRKHKIQIIEVV
jgi:hypothetical protein